MSQSHRSGSRSPPKDPQPIASSSILPPFNPPLTEDINSIERPFADWASGLHFEHSFDQEEIGEILSSSNRPLQGSPGQPISRKDSYKGISQLRNAVDDNNNDDDDMLLAGPSHRRFHGIHGREFSSTSEGDVGNHPYVDIIGDEDHNDSGNYLAIDRGRPRPEDSVSYLGINSSRNSSFIQMGVDENQNDTSEAAFLTANSAPSGKISRSKQTPLLFGQDDDEGTERLMKPGQMNDYFGDDRDDFPQRTVSPSLIEDGEMNVDRGGQRSSADMYARMGISSSRDSDGIGIERAKQGLARVGKSIRRVSRRIVNLEGDGGPSTEGVIRLPDHEEQDESSDTDGDDVYAVQELPSNSAKTLNLRGKSLGIFGPESQTRQFLAKLMLQWWIEPLILLLILLNVSLLIVQSARNVFTHPRPPGYFNYWTDYAFLVIFVLYTVEIIARIIVSGLVINPPDAYEATGDQIDAKEGALTPATETPFTQHLRAKASRSNTKDTFAAMAGTLKVRAAEVIRPHNHLGNLQGPNAAPLSPNRIHAPRTVTSETLRSDSSFPPHHGDTNPSSSSSTGDYARRQASQATTNSSNRWREKTSSFLQKSRLAPFAEAISKQRAQAIDSAFLRHSWNRVDFLAVITFWISFVLRMTKEELTPTHHIFIFQALSTLRCARLLTVTRGTSVILRSLKTAGPLLVNVSFFTLFSMLLFSIIGVQSFEGNYLRSCVWVGDLQSDPNAPKNQNVTLSQICGGYIDSNTGQRMRALNANGDPLGISIKGFICPAGQLCMEQSSNPENNTESFDNIFFALLQVIIVISSNGWSTVMYNMMDADFYASCLYFIIGIIIMNFWMANLFIAVIINTFATISAETKQSAFADERIEPGKPVVAEAENAGAQRRKRVANIFKRVWGYTKWFWIALIVADLGVQGSQASYHKTSANVNLSTAELYLTIAFDLEILMRFLSYLLDNDWRAFFAKRRNKFDLFLAIITSVIQAPPIKNSAVFPWLTVFQLARFYRVIAAVPRMEALLIRVFGSLSGLFNMILFLLLMVGLASLVAVQLFRGDIPEDYQGQTNEINFKQMWNSFLGMYQLLSSENWTTPLYSVLEIEGAYKQAVISGIFLCGWFLFANFIVLQMFVAVITENFGVAESQKRQQQLELYLRNLEKPQTALIVRILHRLSPYRWLRERNAAKMGEELPIEPTGIKASAQKGLERIDEKIQNRRSIRKIVNPSKAQGVIKVVQRIARLDRPEEQMPLDTIRARQFRQSFSGASMLFDKRQNSIYEHVADPSSSTSATQDMDQNTARLFARDRQLRRMRSDLGLVTEEAPNQAEVNAMHENRWKDDPRIAQARMINTHPSYEKSLWLFSNTNKFRRVCQSIVPCSYGERLFGRQTSKFRLRIYQFAIFATVAASVIIAGVATPAYRRQWYQENGFLRDSWFSLAEVTLGFIFILEFFVKVIADGFAFTPNAYLLSPWNALDLFVLLTLIVNVTTELAVIGGVSRFTRALKSFRALRLINLSEILRRTFTGLVTVGGRFVDVSVLALLYIVPFAIWGQNLFSGLLYSCTDSSSGILNKGDCVGEFSYNAAEQNYNGATWTFLAPRVWQNPNEGSVYSFDDFRSSLLILFEIVSLEGWINVMSTAMSVVGFDQQLQTDASQINALFFVIYNLLGAVFVLTLFVAVVIESFQAYSGAAYLTTAQRQWIDLKRLISRQRPSKRPKVKPTDRFRSWCYDRAVHKHGWWSRSMTFLYLVSLVTLATERYEDSPGSEKARDVVYISLASIFAIDIVIRLVGLGWRAYRQDMWNIFDLIVVLGTFTTSIPLLSPSADNVANVQLQKFFLVAVAFKLVQKNNALNQLFKTAISSLPNIATLFLLWIIFFLVWGIMLVEVFGLTKWNINETYNKNFSSLLRALVFLSMISTGEGWNSYMHDYTISTPYCTSSNNYLDTDCGSQGWAYFLFIGWNVISMYIFLNMFTATVVENFSYVFRLGGKPTLSREQVRNFKKAWAEFDTGRSGILTKDQFVPFFNRLEGTLQVRVYPPNATIKALKDKAISTKADRPRSFDASSRGSHSPSRAARMNLLSPLKGGSKLDKEDQRNNFMWPPSPTELVVDGINITVLKRQLRKLDHDEIKMRKERFERLYHEACILHDQARNRGKGGLPFTDMLLLLAHYKLIDDEHALSLDELVDRRELQQRVEDRIETERVRGLLRLLWLRRRFVAIREARQSLSKDSAFSNKLERILESPTNQQIPSIFVQGSSTDLKQKARERPALRLDLGNLGGGSKQVQPVQIVEEASSPGTTHILNEGDLTGEHPSILLTTTENENGLDSYLVDGKRLSPDGLSQRSISPSSYLSELPIDGRQPQLSPSPSLQEIERHASPIIQEIDTSAWGSLARRLSMDAPRSSRSRESERSNDDVRFGSKNVPISRLSNFNPFRPRRNLNVDRDELPQSSMLYHQEQQQQQQQQQGQRESAVSVLLPSNASLSSQDTRDTGEMREVITSDHSSTASISLRGRSTSANERNQM